jgi:hypothetical protein
MKGHRQWRRGLGTGVIRVAGVLLLGSTAGAEMRMAINPTKLHLSLEPGTSRTATVEVSNTGADPIRVITYVVDWTTPREGGMEFLKPGQVDRSASAWVQADLPEFILPPHQSQVVRVSTSVPDTASGAYWTLLFFEGEGEIRQRRLGVGAKARMGTTIYLTASGTEQRDDVLTGMEVARIAGSDSLQLVTSVANRGNVYYYPDGWYQVLDEREEVLFETKLPLRVLLPGRETVYRLPWLPDSPGSRRLVVTVDSGLETLMQGIKRFVVPGEPPVEPEPVPAIPPVIAVAPPVPAAPQGSGSFFGVHVESVLTDAEEVMAQQRYLAKDYAVTIETVDLGPKGTWHRIVLGRFAEAASAREFTRELSANFDLDYMAVVRLDR